MDAVPNNVKILYNDGVLLFTKDNLRRLAEQLEKFRAGRLQGNKLRLTNIRGENVDIILEQGEPAAWVDIRCNHGERLGGPYIYYRSIQDMIEQDDVESSDPKKAYLAIAVMYPASDAAPGGDTLPSGYFDGNTLVSDLSRSLDLIKQQWEACEQYDRLTEVLEPHRAQLSKVKKIVAFALGSLNHAPTLIYPSEFQHAFVLSLQHILSGMKENENAFLAFLQYLRNPFAKNQTAVRCFAQDPAYSVYDKNALAKNGITALNDPRGFLAVDETALVVSIDPNTPVQQIIADIARPLAIIQLRPSRFNHPTNFHFIDRVSPRVQRMLNNEYTEVRLPYHESLRDLSMYIRKPTSN